MKLVIEGMTCEHCVAAVKKALESVPGVTRASVDLAEGAAQIEGTPSTQLLLQAVADEGYEARAA